MAKICFENKFILTRKLHKQYCKVSYTRMRKSSRILAFVLAAASLIAAVALAFYRIKIGVLVSLVLCLYFIMMGFWGYVFSEWIGFRSMKRKYGQVIVMIVDFMPNIVQVKVGKTSLNFKYSSIIKAYETEDIIILILGAKGMIEHGQVLFKANFKGDSLAQFKEFINEKTGNGIFE